MEKLSKVESAIWEIIEARAIGKPSAISQEELLSEITWYRKFEAPKSLRALRAVMRELKTKRPVLESLKNKPGYHKPASWDEIEACLNRRKYAAIRQLSLNKKMLLVCQELFPHQVGEQLRLFEQEMAEI